MKCQFCNERCRLLKEGEPDYSKYAMSWLCRKHPTRVIHHVQLEKYCLRRDHSIQGVTRSWTYTSVTWVNNKKQSMSAFYMRRNDEPGEFEVCRIIRGKDRFMDRTKSVFSLPEHPKDFTPENIADKVDKFIIFS